MLLDLLNLEEDSYSFSLKMKMAEQLIVKFIFYHGNYEKEFVHEIVKIEQFQKTKHQF
jgi:hypothetical protein